MKKIAVILLVVALLCGITSAALAVEIVPISLPVTPIADYVAIPSSHTVYINGESVAFDAYNIFDNNYFKLRDLAYALSGTEKQFEVDWDAESGSIILINNSPYTPVGGEMVGKGSDIKQPFPTQSQILFYEDSRDGEAEILEINAFNIEGNNYFKLRDIGRLFGFGVDWDARNSAVIIDTSKGYTPQINIAIATAELLSQYDSHEEFIEFNDDDYQKILISVSEEIRDFKFIEVELNTENDDSMFMEVSVLYSLDSLTPDSPFVVTWMDLGTMPHRGISFVDNTGATRYFTIGQSGEDGSLMLREF